MKKQAITLVFILILLTPYSQLALAQTDNYFEQSNGLTIQYYKDAAGYDQLLKPDDSVLVYSQRYTIEYLSGKQWKQITTPYTVTQDQEQVTRKYTDYLGTTAEVIYRKTDLGIKSDVVIHSAETREYRIVWSLDGIVNENVRYGDNFVEFYDGDEWLRVDWNDAYNQFGEITDYTLSDSANGKKIDVVFNVGTVEAGKTLILDPALFDSYAVGNQNSYLELEDNHPSAAAFSAMGQSFTGVKGNITSVKFNLRKSGNPTGNAYAKLYAHNGVYGASSTPGALLATSEPLDVSTLNGAAFQLEELFFNASNTYQMTQGTYYCIAFETPATGTINAANDVWIGLDTAAPTASGNLFRYNAGWGAQAGQDTIYYLYANVTMEAPELSADATFSRDTPGWLNVTVFDPLGVTDINTVTAYINTTGDVNNFTLRWTQATNTFSEVSDPDDICDLNAESVRNNINATHDLICFNFNITGGQSGLCDVRIVVTSDTATTGSNFFPDAFTFSYFNWNTVVYDLINSAFEFWSPSLANAMNDLKDLVTGVTSYWSLSINNFVLLLVQQFRIITNVINWYIRWFTRFVSFFIDLGTFFVQVWNGGLDAAYNFWDIVDIDQWYEVVPIFAFIYWLESVYNRGRAQGETKVFLDDIQSAMNITSYFTTMFMMVINTVVDYTFRLFDAIT